MKEFLKKYNHAIAIFLWFAYIAVTFAYFFFADKQDFLRLCIFLFTGMTICLIIYYIWPNGQNLRPDLAALGRENIFTRIVEKLYSTVCLKQHSILDVFWALVLAVPMYLLAYLPKLTSAAQQIRKKASAN